MTTSPGSILRLAVRPDGWFAGARAMLLSAGLLLGGLGFVTVGLLTADALPVAIGIAMTVGSLGSGAILAYAAANSDRRRASRQAPEPPPPPNYQGLLDIMFERIDRMEDRLMNVIREGRAQHTLEHQQQATTCLALMKPLQDDFSGRQRSQQATEARIGPIKRGFAWATNHWQITCAVLGLIASLIFAIGWSRP